MPYYPYSSDPGIPVDSNSALVFLVIWLIFAALGSLVLWYDYHRSHRRGHHH